MGTREIRRGRRTVTLTHLDRVWWPAHGLRKNDVVDYYRAVAGALLPHLRDRPFTIKRHFTVPRGPFVWEKDAPPETPEWVARCPQPAKSRGGEIVHYVLANDELALLWLVEYGCVDLHVWTSRCDRPELPTHVLFDLDPAGVEFRDVVRAAHLLHDALRALELDAYVRTSGGAGLHVLVPIARRHTHEQARAFAAALATAVARGSDGLVTREPVKARRHGVYVDTKMNGHGQQTVAAYSVRPRPEAAVATPLAWEELDEELDPAALTMRAAADRVARLGDVHAPLLRGRQRIDVALAALRAAV